MKIDPYVLEAIKGMDLPALMQSHGIILKPVGKNAYQTNCPFHDDKTPSLSVGFRNNKWMWNCFGCREHGNYLDFRIAYEKIPFTDAYQKSVEELKTFPALNNGHFLSLPPAEPRPSSPPPSSKNQGELLNRAVQIYHDALLEDRRGRDYLAGRGIKDPELIRRFKIGFVDGRLKKMLPEDETHETVQELKEIGLLNGREHFLGCVVFPIIDENGGVTSFYGRRIEEEAPTHLYLPGPRRGVWNGAAFKAHKDIILTESIIDALSLHQLGFGNAVPLYGVNGFTDDHLRLMRENRTRRVFLCLDNDDAGREARGRIKAKLEPLGVEATNITLPLEYKDINEALQRGFTAEQFKKLLPLPDVLLSTRPDSPTALTQGLEDGRRPTGPTPPTVEQKDDAVFLDFGARRYRVKGLSGKNREDLRVNIKVESVGEAAGGAHLDAFDLYSAKSRAAFTAQSRKIFSADEKDMARELNQIIDQLESLRSSWPEGPAGEKPPDIKKMPPEEEQEALQALRSPSLLKDILRDMDALGYVGEDANKAIGYLVGVSRKLDNPLSCSIISQSSAGKSVLAETIEKLTPPEDVLVLSRATPTAFFYIIKDGLKHKLVIMEERVGAEQADYAIRTLQSKKRLSQMVTIKDESTGDMKTKFFEVEGPIAYIETTTQLRIHEENATRSFELYLDQSIEQTERIHARQKASKTLGGLKNKGKEDEVLRRHHNMQRLLKPARVIIPYVNHLHFPATWLRTRRDHQRFLNLIEVITFLHQYQRETKTADGLEYIESTTADYETAYFLARQVMGESFTDLKKPQRELLEQIQKLSVDTITRRQVRETTGLPHRRCWELLEDLAELEYLEKVQGKQGQVCRYRLAEHAWAGAKTLEGLTTPEELSALWP